MFAGTSFLSQVVAFCTTQPLTNVSEPQMFPSCSEQRLLDHGTCSLLVMSPRIVVQPMHCTTPRGALVLRLDFVKRVVPLLESRPFPLHLISFQPDL